MAYQFNLEQPTNIAFGPSAINRLNDFLSPDSRVALVCGSSTLFSNGSVQRVIDLIDGTVTSIQIGSHEPTLESVDDLTKRLCQASYDFVIALGGGSTLDSVKASSVLATQDPPSNSLAYLEGIGTGRRLSKPGLSTILIPTTAGTGTEVTKNAVIYSPEHGVKKSLRSRLLLADAVIIDPTLQTSCSQRVTIHSGMDAITQCFESYISVRATEYTRVLAKQGFQLGLSNIDQAVNHPSDLNARTAMAHCAFNSGIALANGGLGVAHGISSALSVTANLSHGAACAILLPFAAELNFSACPELYDQLATAVGLHDGTELMNNIRNLSARFGMTKTFNELGIDTNIVPDLVERSYGNSMNGNPFMPEPDFLTSRLLDYYT